MAVPNYTYMKLKMLGPNGVITLGSTFSHAFTCDREHFELAAVVINKPTSSMTFRPHEENQGGGNRPHRPNQDGAD